VCVYLEDTALEHESSTRKRVAVCDCMYVCVLLQDTAVERERSTRECTEALVVEMQATLKEVLCVAVCCSVSRQE